MGELENSITKVTDSKLEAFRVVIVGEPKAEDVKWLVENIKESNDHFAKLNREVAYSVIKLAKRVTMIAIIVALIVAGATALGLILKLTGVF